MNTKNIKWLTSGLLGLVLAFGLGSCSDDHYDLNSNNASSTLWDNVVSTQQCDSFMQILSRCYVDQKAYGVPRSLTYAELLKSTKVMTVWAPKDGTYNAKKWLDLLDTADATTNRVAATELYKKVEKQFAQNHLSYFDYNGSYVESKRIALANGKYADYDVNSIRGVNIPDGDTKNMACINGTVHLLESSIPYAYDLREILEAYPQLSEMNDYISSKDTMQFFPSLSTEGAIVNGEMQYVDSVFYEYNKIMPSIASDADSLCAAIYFTNEAWKQAVDHVKKFYTYKPVYTYKLNNQVYSDTLLVDSLQEVNAIYAIFRNMYYSLNEQLGFDMYSFNNLSGPQKLDCVKNYFETADSLVSTEYYGLTDEMYNTPATLYRQHAPDCHELTAHTTPIEASNGYVFMVDQFNFKANKAWQYKKIYEVEGGHIVNLQNSKNLAATSMTGISHSLTSANLNQTVQGSVSKNQYQEFKPSSAAGNPEVAFDLSDVLSGTYDIYIVMVPENMDNAYNTTPKKNKFSASLVYDYDDKANPIAIDANGGEDYETDPTKVDTIQLFKDFKFDVCYYDISKVKPMLRIKSDVKLKDRSTCTNQLYVDCILLVPKDE